MYGEWESCFGFFGQCISFLFLFFCSWVFWVPFLLRATVRPSLPDPDRIPGNPIVKRGSELQGLHHFIDTLVFKSAGQFIHPVLLIIEPDLHIIPSFQLQGQLSKRFFTENQFVLHPRSLLYRPIGGIRYDWSGNDFGSLILLHRRRRRSGRADAAYPRQVELIRSRADN